VGFHFNSQILLRRLKIASLHCGQGGLDGRVLLRAAGRRNA
jgi:hypothetical protein